MCGTLFASAAYANVDPEYPPQRVAHILEDIKAPAMITQKMLHEKLTQVLPVGWNAGIGFIFTEDWDSSVFGKDAAPTLDLSTMTPSSLAYSVFSSGSTGKAKGSLIEHRSLVNAVENYIQFMELEAGDRVLQFFNPAFDGGQLDIWTTLCSGATLVCWDSKSDFTGMIKDNEVNKLALSPSALAVVDENLDRNLMQRIVTAAEPIPLALAKTWAARSGLVNLYGPSECTVFCTGGQIPPSVEMVTIGKPTSNVPNYILQHQALTKQPVGVPGELCVGGCQVARGYLERPELTAEKFVPNPFLTGRDDRMYRTGDMVSWTDKGDIVFIGRFDFQVKIRGFRIELGEIEAALQAAGASLSLVIVENEQLVAAVTPELDAQNLKKAIGKTLPPFMVPNKIMTMAEMPMTVNGKIDRDKLRQMLREFGEDETVQFVEPRSPLEIRVAGLVCEVLGLQRISVTDDLKSAGLSSLKAVKLVTKLREAGIQSIFLTELYQCSAVEDIVTLVEQYHRAGSFVIDGDEDALALDTRRTACPVSSTMNSLCFGILTLMAWLWFGAALVLPVLLPAELGRILWKQIGFWEAFAFLGFAGMPLYFFGVAMMVVLTKWIVIGRYREKTRETGSLFFFRWWLVDRLYDVATQTVLGHMRGGPLHYYFLRLLGLKASAYCQIETRDIREWDLVMILGGSIIAEGCSIRPAVLEEGRIHLRWIRIGGNVLIGESSHVLAGAKICDNVTLMPMSLVSGREAELPPFTTWEGAPLRAVEGKTASRSRFGSSANRSLECSPRMSTRQSLNATPRHMRSPEASPRMGAPMSPARRSSYGSPGIGSSVDRTSSVPLLVSHMRFSSDSVMQIRTHNSPWTGLVVLRQLITDIIALGMSGLVLLAGAACAYAILGLLVNAWVKEWDWIQEEKGFFILAIAITYTPLAIPFVDILSGVDYNEAWKSLQNHWEGEDFLLQLVMMVILVIALTSAGLVSALLAVVFTRLGGKVPTNLSASKPQHRVGLFCLRLAWPRYPAQFNGTLGTAVWLRLLGAKVHLTSIITLAEPPSNAGMLEVKRRSVVAGAMLCTSSFERSSSGELKRIKGTVEIGEHCVVAGLLPPGTKVSSYGVVAGLTVSPGVVYKNLAAAGTPAFQAKSPMLPREFVTRRCTDRLTHVLSVLYPLLCPPLLNMIFMLIFVPATVPLDLWEEEIQASGGRGIHIVMICIIPALFLVIGVAFGVCTMLLKWLLSLLDCVSQRGEDGCRWRPMIRPKYYLDLLINTIIGLGMGQFMSFTVGTKVYSLWLYMLGADVHPSALIFTRVADFSRVSVGADAIVCHGAALGTTRMLQVEGGGTAVAHSSVVVAPRSTVGYGSAVTCAETGDLSVSGALTSLPPDLILPPRSLAIGSTPHRFEWHRDNVKQLDQSPAYAPDLMKDVVLPKTFQSNLLKTLRLRTQRLSSTVMEHSTVKCALVTGANGFLGRYITAELLKLEENPEVICFVRGKDEDEAKARLLKSLADAGISEARAFGPKGRVRVVCGDLGKELLGLDREKFHELAETVTHIYHSGARVNHAEPYEHLRRENVWGTAKLLEFSVAQTLKEFHYVSTYSTTTVDMLGPDGLMSEEAPLGNIRTGLLGGSCELTGGYVFSKWTAEQLVILAGEEGAKCAIHRPGMIGGQSVDGKSGDDNFVNFLNDIVRMGMIPRLVGAMFNTTPVDFVAYSIVHASRQPKTDKGVRRFHPIAKDSDLDSRDIYELLNRKGYHIRWCGFPEFRKLAKAQGDGMKSWLLIAGLTGEGHGMDSMADNRNSWEHMRKARGAATWRPQDTLSKMIDYLMSKGKLPLPTARPSGARHRNLSMD